MDNTIFDIHISNDMNININIDIPMNIDITPTPHIDKGLSFFTEIHVSEKGSVTKNKTKTPAASLDAVSGAWGYPSI